MDTTTLYLIRHGQVQGWEERRYNGQTDVDLTETGRRQLEAVARDLADVDLAAVYSSDLKRAAFGGRALVRDRGIDLVVEPGFRELHFGIWEGMSSDEVRERYPGELERRYQNMTDHVIPGGETIREFWDRVGAKAWEVLVRHKGGNVAVVAHSGVNRAILLQALGCGPDKIWRVDQGFGCLNVIEYFGDGASLVKLANGPNPVQGQ
ncbi:MAG: histidine phosphatase family protein [Proteobacteria bacterium]|nr:histidine phosphatase family protein [Pseudomonadota bacterium]